MYDSWYEDILIKNNIPNNSLTEKIQHWCNKFVEVIHNKLNHSLTLVYDLSRNTCLNMKYYELKIEMNKQQLTKEIINK